VSFARRGLPLVNRLLLWLLLCGWSALPAAAQSATPPVLNPENGHWYQAVRGPGGITWDEARAAAEQRSFAGYRGHLLTLTSEAENQFVLSRLPFMSQETWWIGGYQDQNAPDYREPHVRLGGYLVEYAPPPTPTTARVGTLPNPVVGGLTMVGVVSLDRPAGPGDLVIPLTSSDARVAAVPAVPIGSVDLLAARPSELLRRLGLTCYNPGSHPSPRERLPVSCLLRSHKRRRNEPARRETVCSNHNVDDGPAGHHHP
jgi:hypothetical protein